MRIEPPLPPLLPSAMRRRLRLPLHAVPPLFNEAVRSMKPRPPLPACSEPALSTTIFAAFPNGPASRTMLPALPPDSVDAVESIPSRVVTGASTVIEPPGPAATTIDCPGSDVTGPSMVTEVFPCSGPIWTGGPSTAFPPVGTMPPLMRIGPARSVSRAPAASSIVPATTSRPRACTTKLCSTSIVSPAGSTNCATCSVRLSTTTSCFADELVDASSATPAPTTATAVRTRRIEAQSKHSRGDLSRGPLRRTLAPDAPDARDRVRRSGGVAPRAGGDAAGTVRPARAGDVEAAAEGARPLLRAHDHRHADGQLHVQHVEPAARGLRARHRPRRRRRRQGRGTGQERVADDHRRGEQPHRAEEHGRRRAGRDLDDLRRRRRRRSLPHRPEPAEVQGRIHGVPRAREGEDADRVPPGAPVPLDRARDLHAHVRGLPVGGRGNGACRDRTGDLRLAKAALSQLS